MCNLALVRHSAPEIVPDEPASQWRLSDEGRRRCELLAHALTAYHPDVVVSSVEPKAVETGQIVARLLQKPFEQAEGLHEHDRRGVGFMGTRERFEAAVAGFFREPHKRVLGEETADQAHRRFAGAVAGVLALHPDENVAVVAHGTVMTLLVARAAGLSPFPFWQRLGLPAFVVLSRPTFSLITVVERVG